MLKSIVKSAVTVLMSAALCLSLAACGGPAEPEALYRISDPFP